jgi:hypothetical protein
LNSFECRRRRVEAGEAAGKSYGSNMRRVRAIVVGGISVRRGQRTNLVFFVFVPSLECRAIMSRHYHPSFAREDAPCGDQAKCSLNPKHSLRCHRAVDIHDPSSENAPALLYPGFNFTHHCQNGILEPMPLTMMVCMRAGSHTGQLALFFRCEMGVPNNSKINFTL